MAMDMATKYYDKRESSKDRKYYSTLDEMLIDKGRSELVGKNITPSWLGVKNIGFEKNIGTVGHFGMGKAGMLINKEFEKAIKDMEERR